MDPPVPRWSRSGRRSAHRLPSPATFISTHDARSKWPEFVFHATRWVSPFLDPPLAPVSSLAAKCKPPCNDPHLLKLLLDEGRRLLQPGNPWEVACVVPRLGFKPFDILLARLIVRQLWRCFCPGQLLHHECDGQLRALQGDARVTCNWIIMCPM